MIHLSNVYEILRFLVQGIFGEERRYTMNASVQ